MKPRVLVLGSRGLLGSSLIQEFSSSDKVELVFTSRRSDTGIFFDPNLNSLDDLLNSTKPNYVVNCIGVIKQRISQAIVSPSVVVRINSLFPLQISELTDKYSFKLLQIGTDCVFSGKVGSYTENSDHDSEDLYGNSKSLGEPINQNSMLIRTSFIGPEIENRLSFYEWVKNWRYQQSDNLF
jgi:dTDP-4-dehydrorhamnose reductase